MSDTNWWGWGPADHAYGPGELDDLAKQVALLFDEPVRTPEHPAALQLVDAPAPRVEVPESLADRFDLDRGQRILHAKGQSFHDVVRAFHGEVGRVPDAVLRPRDAEDVGRLLDWADGAEVAVVPFGGGTSVVGGVSAPVDDPRPVVSLDLGRMDRVTDVDEASLAVRIEAGATGPRLEEQLRAKGLSLRFYPQSWEHSTLGGWVATRAGGHFATGPTHVDDLVEAIEGQTPTGPYASRRLPASGAGPSPDRLWLGSEGTIGVVTAAWVRALRRPDQRASVTILFPRFEGAIAAVRDVVQAGLRPSNARVLDPMEALVNGAGDGSKAVLALGFEGTGRWLGSLLDPATKICRDHGGLLDGMPKMVAGDRTDAAEGGAAQWRRSFLRAPYTRDALVRLGLVVETFETAITWDRAERFVEDVRERTRRAAEEAGGGRAMVSVRVTHAYPDGLAPYFTVVLPGRGGADRAKQWAEVKAAASEAILDGGGTITHHHAVGRDHAPWWRRQRPDAFGRAWDAARRELDPHGIMNPGVLA